MGIGRAATALDGELQSVGWNPATLGGVQEVTASLSYYQGPLDFSVTQLAAALPAGGVGTLGLALNVQDFGDIPLFDSASSDLPVGSVSPNNLILGLTIARRLTGRLVGGATVRWIHSDLLDSRGASTLGVDGGLLWAPLAGVPAKLGLSVTNLGPDLDGGGLSASSPLPSRFRLGVSCDVLEPLRPTGDLGLLLAVDLEHAARKPATGSQYIGAELRIGEVLFLRAGYISETLIDTNHGAALGVGFAVGPVRFDLAREYVNRLGDETHLSASARL